MFVITYLQTQCKRIDHGVIFINTEEELERYKKEMGSRPVTNTTLINLFEEADGFQCIINEV